jgi:hypothetical protein
MGADVCNDDPSEVQILVTRTFLNDIEIEQKDFKPAIVISQWIRDNFVSMEPVTPE